MCSPSYRWRRCCHGNHTSSLFCHYKLFQRVFLWGIILLVSGFPTVHCSVPWDGGRSRAAGRSWIFTNRSGIFTVFNHRCALLKWVLWRSHTVPPYTCPSVMEEVCSDPEYCHSQMTTTEPLLRQAEGAKSGNYGRCSMGSNPHFWMTAITDFLLQLSQSLVHLSPFLWVGSLSSYPTAAFLWYPSIILSAYLTDLPVSSIVTSFWRNHLSCAAKATSHYGVWTQLPSVLMHCCNTRPSVKITLWILSVELPGWGSRSGLSSCLNCPAHFFTVLWEVA